MANKKLVLIRVRKAKISEDIKTWENRLVCVIRL
jgi:hypothetical protein